MKHANFLPQLTCNFFLLVMFSLSFSCVNGAIIYVNPLAAGSNTGLSWSDAYLDLQSALASASSGDEIWVANGVYIPSVEIDVDASGGSDPREKTFQIPSGVAVYGGFLGNELAIEDRDWKNNLTILSGDLDLNDVDLDGNKIAETSSDIVGNNVYHVVFTQNVSSTTLLDGFIITAGSAGNLMPAAGFSPNRDGGGWLDLDGVSPNSSSPRIYNCRFEGNFAESRGGGFKIGSFQPGTFQPNISNCSFSGNEALRSGGAIYLLGDETQLDSSFFSNNKTTNISGSDTGPAAGGAITLIASNATLNANIFKDNSATGNPTGPFEGGGGGAVYVNHSVSPTNTLGPSLVTFINCGFYNNSVGGNGGAWGGAVVNYSDGGNLTTHYIGCVFSGNFATDDGGAVAHFTRIISEPDILPAILEPSYINCTFSNNNAGQEGGALFLNGFENMGTEILTASIENCVLYGNSAGGSDPEIFNDASTLISYSLIQGSGGSGGAWDANLGTDGGNNLDTDPQFPDPLDPDGADNIPGNSDDGLFPLPISPLINNGNPVIALLAGITYDFSGGTRIQGASIDIGAYEQEGGLVCGPIPAGLLNQDVGNTGAYVGSVCYDMGNYTIDASGSGIWGRKDGFHFIYKTLQGNGEIIARVDNIGLNSPWDLAGVMMRESLSNNSKNVFMGLTSAEKAIFQRRRRRGGLTGFFFAGNGDFPKWVRIIRYGNFFAGFKSDNGVHWKWAGLFYVPMNHKIFVGIASSTPTALAGTPNTYKLSELSINGISYLNDPFEGKEITEVPEREGPREFISPKTGFSLVYPNPAKNNAQFTLQVEIDDQVEIDLLDLQGRLVRTIYKGDLVAHKSYNFRIERNEIAQGLYIIRTKGQQTYKSLQLIFDN